MSEPAVISSHQLSVQYYRKRPRLATCKTMVEAARLLDFEDESMNLDDEQKNEFARLMKAFQAAQERNDINEIESLGAQCLELAGKHAQRNPSEHLRVCLEAHEHEDAARWDQAEAAFRQALVIAEAEGNQLVICRGHQDLCALFVLRGMAESALKEAEAAIAALGDEDMPPVRANALEGLFRCQVRNGHHADAAATVEEAFRTLPTEKMHEIPRARTLMMRARCRLHQGEIALADQDLVASWQILSPKAEAKFLAGFQSSLANWWEIKAGIIAQAGDLEGAAQAMGQALDFRRTVSQLPQLNGPHKHYALAVTLQKYALALRAAGIAPAAIAAFEESQKIQERCGFALPPP